MSKIINSNLILNYIKEKQITKTQFCRKCGIGIKSLNKVLSGDEEAFISTVFKICKAMGVSVSQICKVDNCFEGSNN